MVLLKDIKNGISDSISELNELIYKKEQEINNLEDKYEKELEKFDTKYIKEITCGGGLYGVYNILLQSNYKSYNHSKKENKEAIISLRARYAGEELYTALSLKGAKELIEYLQEVVEFYEEVE